MEWVDRHARLEKYMGPWYYLRSPPPPTNPTGCLFYGEQIKPSASNNMELTLKI